MKKRFLNLFLALALIVCVLPMAVSAAPSCYHEKASKYCTVKPVEAKAPTCVDEGYEAHYACTVCETIFKLEDQEYKTATKEIVPATEIHNYTKKIAQVSAKTCTKAQVNTYQCATCDKTEDREVGKPMGHTEVPNPGKPATCSEAGRTDGTKCSVCGVGIKSQHVIPATNKHSYTVQVRVVKEATCTEANVDIKKCETCEATKQIWGEALGHTEVPNPGYAPTCTKTGRTDGTKCSVCNVGIKSQHVIPATGHAYTVDLGYKEGKEPTCKSEGLRILGCANENCNEKTTQTVPALVHAYTEDLGYKEGAEPTCEKDGLRILGCVNCDDKTAQKVAAFGHAYTEDLGYKEGKAPTCEKEGQRILGCTKCGEKTVQTVPPLGHNYVENILVAPTCTQKGMKEVRCANEGDGVWSRVLIDETGHNMVTVDAVPATCTKTGLTEGKKCSVCAWIEVKQEATPMVAHSWKEMPAVPATCTTDGNNAHLECDVCGATENKEVYPAAHNFVNDKCTVCGARITACTHEDAVKTSETPATCINNGSNQYTCNDCGDTFTEVVPAVGHSYSNGVCGNCGAVDPNNVAPTCSHSNGVTTETVPPTCGDDGYVTARCGDCGEVVRTDLMPATGHSYVEGVCSNCGRKEPGKMTYDYQDVFLTGK